MKKNLIFSIVAFLFFVGCIGCASAPPKKTPVEVKIFTVICKNIITVNGTSRACGYEFTPTTSPWARCEKCGGKVLVPPDYMWNSTPQPQVATEQVPFPHHLFMRPRSYSDTEYYQYRQGGSKESWGNNWYVSNWWWTNYRSSKHRRVHYNRTRQSYHWP